MVEDVVEVEVLVEVLVDVVVGKGMQIPVRHDPGDVPNKHGVASAKLPLYKHAEPIQIPVLRQGPEMQGVSWGTPTQLVGRRGAVVRVVRVVVRVEVREVVIAVLQVGPVNWGEQVH